MHLLQLHIVLSVFLFFGSSARVVSIHENASAQSWPAELSIRAHGTPTLQQRTPQAFRLPPQPPPLFTHDAISIRSEATKITSEAEALQQKIIDTVSTGDASFENVVQPVISNDDSLTIQRNILQIYQGLSADADLRKASGLARSIFADSYAKIMSNIQYYKFLSAALKNEESLDKESQGLMSGLIAGMKSQGVALEGDSRETFTDVRANLDTNMQSFETTLQNDQTILWYVSEELGGLNEVTLGSFPQAQDDHGEIIYGVQLKGENVGIVMNLCDDALTRKATFLKSLNIVPGNAKRLYFMVDARRQISGIFDEPDYATLLWGKSGPETINKFVDSIPKALKQERDEVIKRCLEKKKSIKAPNDDNEHVYLWDQDILLSYLATDSTDEDEFSREYEAAESYFPVLTTLGAVLDLYGELFGLVFQPAEGQDRDKISPTGKGGDIVWHPDCKVYLVWNTPDKGDDFVGYLYLDLFARQDKTATLGHASLLEPGFKDKNGRRHFPVTSITTNFAAVTPDKPSLLDQDELRVLFHELGHVIHNLVSKTKYRAMHGTSVSSVFVEAPSQMLENLLSVPEVVKRIGCHYSYVSQDYYDYWLEEAGGGSIKRPPKEMDDEQAQMILKASASPVNEIWQTLETTRLAKYDLAIHSSQRMTQKAMSQLSCSLYEEMFGFSGPGGNDWGMSPTLNNSSEPIS